MGHGTGEIKTRGKRWLDRNFSCQARFEFFDHTGGQRDGWFGGHGCEFLRQWRDHRGRVGLCDAEPLGQGREGACGGIAEGAQRHQQHRQEDMDPLIRFALNHPEQAPLHDLERIRFQVDQDEQEPICPRRQGAVLVHGKPARGPRLPIHAPRRHTGVERGLEGWGQLLKLIEGYAGEIQELYRAGP
jgi:hypothetical protein